MCDRQTRAESRNRGYSPHREFLDDTLIINEINSIQMSSVSINSEETKISERNFVCSQRNKGHYARHLSTAGEASTTDGKEIKRKAGEGARRYPERLPSTRTAPTADKNAAHRLCVQWEVPGRMQAPSGECGIPRFHPRRWAVQLSDLKGLRRPAGNPDQGKGGNPAQLRPRSCYPPTRTTACRRNSTEIKPRAARQAASRHPMRCYSTLLTWARRRMTSQTMRRPFSLRCL
jgi:hypothetical protein